MGVHHKAGCSKFKGDCVATADQLIHFRMETGVRLPYNP